jgi:hypothetical protein
MGCKKEKTKRPRLILGSCRFQWNFKEEEGRLIIFFFYSCCAAKDAKFSLLNHFEGENKAQNNKGRRNIYTTGATAAYIAVRVRHRIYDIFLLFCFSDKFGFRAARRGKRNKCIFISYLMSLPV